MPKAALVVAPTTLAVLTSMEVALEEAAAGNLGAGGFYDRFGREPGQP